ncbi:deleted in azoospermia-like [Dunckerocampus dactyliophorus]|uniref:deleted in azoospermia-like n=1 Tax=Dunckerocampus dactyliophorus TaxID=161453 RepID=UPI002405FED8|nr:deleted in azoospermia-like [Dunckerocampus dactyliophorus]
MDTQNPKGNKDTQNPKGNNHVSPSSQLSNGYILPEGKVNPNAIFVFFGIDTKANAADMRDMFAKFGQIKEVKIITYRGGFSKGYGFVYFAEDVDIQSIVDQQIIWKGRILKLGPAIMKQRNCRVRQSPRMGLEHWINPSQYFYCTCYPPNGASVTSPSPLVSGGATYYQPYNYPHYGGFMGPQVPVSNTHNAYCYQYTLPYWMGDQRARADNQNVIECGSQTVLSAL